MNESDERFVQIGREHLELLQSRGFGESSSLLDIGCGYGRLTHAIVSNLRYVGRYVGVDLLARHVRWCQETFVSRRPNVQFQFANIYNERYNSRGILDARAYKFTLEDNAFDFCCLFSVFTHMYEDEIRNYLNEIRRVLKRKGTCIATFFLFDKDRLAILLDGSIR